MSTVPDSVLPDSGLPNSGLPNSVQHGSQQPTDWERSQDRERVRDANPIEDVVGEYLTLVPSGRTLKSLCPFHQEKTPSFHVDPARGSFRCFGCGERGDVFSFVQKQENIDFVQALKLLAERRGIQLSQVRSRRAPRPGELGRQRATCVVAAGTTLVSGATTFSPRWRSVAVLASARFLRRVHSALRSGLCARRLVAFGGHPSAREDLSGGGGRARLGSGAAVPRWKDRRVRRVLRCVSASCRVSDPGPTGTSRWLRCASIGAIRGSRQRSTQARTQRCEKRERKSHRRQQT